MTVDIEMKHAEKEGREVTETHIPPHQTRVPWKTPPEDLMTHHTRTSLRLRQDLTVSKRECNGIF